MNFGSLLGAVAGLLPGYMEGERQAVKDNWQDLTNYNQVQQGQLGNLFLEGTMPQRFQMFNAQAYRQGLGAINDTLATLAQYYGAPGQMLNGAANSIYAPENAMLNAALQNQALKMGYNHPWAFGGFANGAHATVPNGVR